MSRIFGRLRHKAQEARGAAKQKMGRHGRNPDMHSEGVKDKAEAKAKEAKDRATEAVKDAKNTLKGK